MIGRGGLVGMGAAALALVAACNAILGNDDKVLAIDAAGAIESGVGDEGDSAGNGSSSDGGVAAVEAAQIPDAGEVETPAPDVVVTADAAEAATDVVVAEPDGCSPPPPTTVGCSAVDLYNYPQQYCTVTPNNVYAILPTPPECLCDYACSCILAHTPCPTGQMTTSQSLGVTCETGSTGGVALGCADAADGGSGSDASAKCGSNVLTPIAAVALSSTSNLASQAIDRDFTTRWESAQGIDPEWIYVDLGAPAFINRVQLAWVQACAADYDLQVSNDASTWATIRSITGNSLGGASPSDWSTAADHQGLVGVGRYLRVFGKTRCNTSFGYSMWEMQVSGDPNPNCSP